LAGGGKPSPSRGGGPGGQRAAPDQRGARQRMSKDGLCTPEPGMLTAFAVGSPIHPKVQTTPAFKSPPLLSAGSGLNYPPPFSLSLQ
jgi:hypothetical protein